MRHVRTVVAMLLGLALLAAGCANVPDETQPEVVEQGAANKRQQSVPQPERGLNPLTAVRDFVEASGQPLNAHAKARVYLGPKAKQSWRPSGGATIIDDSFNTVYAPSDQQPKDEKEKVVLVTGAIVGTLSSDNAFIPQNTDKPLQVRVRLRMQPNGEWRIANAPSKLIITKSDFKVHYFRVPVYYFAPSSATLVPDLRYVPAKPSSDLPSKVVDLLLDGPSSGLSGAVRNPLGDKAALETNVRNAPDGALVVPLTGVADRSEQQKKLIVAQLVTSLENVTPSRVRPLSDGSPLINGQSSWRLSDLPAYDAASSLSSELSGLFVRRGRVYSLADGKPVAGPAGSGAYQVVGAAQSIDGSRLALVEQSGDGVRLRVGPVNGPTQIVDLAGSRMTAPTWQPSSSSDRPSHVVWTVVDGKRVVRVQNTPEGTWAPQAVDASELTELGTITALRLSRDGTRVAAVVDGQLVIASVVLDSSSVTLRAPRVLQSDNLTKVVDVAWLGQHTVVAATSSAATPVVRLPIDGLRLDAYSSSNLTPPIRAIAAAPGRPVVAADQVGMYTASDVGEVWRPHEQSQPGAVPFYPG